MILFEVVSCPLFMECDIVGLGSASIDSLLFVKEYPPADTKVRLTNRIKQGGGLCATALVAAARLGARCAFAGTLGPNDESELVKRLLEADGIDVSTVQYQPRARPNCVTIIVDETHQTRTIFSDPYLGPFIPLPLSLLTRTKVLHVDHSSVAAHVDVLRQAVQSGVQIVADFEREYEPGVREAFPYVQHLVVSVGFAQRYTGLHEVTNEPFFHSLWGEHRTVVVVTCGRSGCYFSEDGGSTIHHQPAFEVKSVDTTGCGDVFHGAYAWGLSRDMPLEQRIRYASACAALKSLKAGGQAGAPTLQEVEAFLGERR